MNNDKQGHVYVAIFDAMPNLCKIGKSENADERIDRAASDEFLPGPYKYRYIEVEDMSATEKQLHEYFSVYHYDGEWFAHCEKKVWDTLPTLSQNERYFEYLVQQDFSDARRAKTRAAVHKILNKNKE